jgi:parallel beta-helix repeat protein
LKRAISTLILFILLVLVIPSIRLHAAVTKMSVVPNYFEVLPEDTFTVNVTVEDMNDLSAWQVTLKYNGTVINCTEAWIPDGDVFAGEPNISVPSILNEPTYERYSQVPRTMDGYNYTLFGNTLLSGSVNVTHGILCRLNFTVLMRGSTFLSIATKDSPVQFTETAWDLSYSLLLNSNSQEMTFTQESGTVVSGRQYNLAILAAGGGITSPPSGTYSYYEGTVVQVNATASNGYFFDHWVLDGSTAGSANPKSVTMTVNHTLTPVFVQAQSVGTIYVRTDGAIDPVVVPLATEDNVTYSFLGSFSNSNVVVQRSNIVIDGNGYTLQGNGTGEGFSLYGVDNVTIKNTNIKGFDRGVHFYSTHQSSIIGNNITENNYIGVSLFGSNNVLSGNNVSANNGDGIRLELSSYNTLSANVLKGNLQGIFLDHSWNNTLVGNSISENTGVGICLSSSSNNSIHHNNLASNTNQILIMHYGDPSVNVWDNGFEGNYWSNYTSLDSDRDGIGDVQYVIDVGNIDNYPLSGMFSGFKAIGNFVTVISNSTLNDFEYFGSNHTIRMHVSNIITDQSHGFCRVCIPHELLNVTGIQVTIDNGAVAVLDANFNVADNGTHRWIYFAYEHSTHEVLIQSDTTPPVIHVILPENKTYSVNSVSMAITVDESTSWIGYSLNGKSNVTVPGNTTLAQLPEGSHTMRVYANDTAGNMGFSNLVYFTVDTVPPNVVVLSPEDRIYATNLVPLNFKAGEEVSWRSYSVDGQNNVTIAGNTTLASLADGTHTVIVYVNDTVGNMGASAAIRFVIDTLPPNIAGVFQDPSDSTVLPTDEISVNVTVVDDLSGVRRVTLIYAWTNSNGTWATVLEMTSLDQHFFNAMISRFPVGTNVTYMIMAEDNAGNLITTSGMGMQYNYSVVPEFSSLLVLSLFMIMTLLVAAYRLCRRACEG